MLIKVELTEARDFFLVRKYDRLACKDCKVIQGESLRTQHRLVVLDICIRSRKRVVNKMCPKTKWRNLKGERPTIFKGKAIVEGDWDFERETPAIGKQMANCIRKVAKEVLEESKGKRHYHKETWWWRFRKLFERRDITKFGRGLGIWKTMRCIRRQRKRLRK